MDGDFSGDTQTSDTITYTETQVITGSNEAQIMFSIITGGASCIYGSILNLGTK